MLSSADRIPERLANLSGVVACAALALALMLGAWRAEGALEWTMTLAEFGAAALVVAASAPESWASRLLSAPPLVATGILSYGIYLWHYPAAVYFRDRWPWYETVPMVLAIAFLAAAMSHLLIERPLQGFRRNLKPTPEVEPAAADAEPAVGLASSR